MHRSLEQLSEWETHMDTEESTLSKADVFVQLLIIASLKENILLIKCD